MGFDSSIYGFGAGAQMIMITMMVPACVYPRVRLPSQHGEKRGIKPVL